MSHSQFHSIELFILTHAWLNLWDKRMTTGRINQVTKIYSNQYFRLYYIKHYSLTTTSTDYELNRKHQYKRRVREIEALCLYKVKTWNMFRNFGINQVMMH